MIVNQLIPVIRAVVDSGIGVLLIEQFAAVALSLATSAHVMEGGVLRYSGTAAELKAQPGPPALRVPAARRGYCGRPHPPQRPRRPPQRPRHPRHRRDRLRRGAPLSLTLRSLGGVLGIWRVPLVGVDASPTGPRTGSTAKPTDRDACCHRARASARRPRATRTVQSTAFEPPAQTIHPCRSRAHLSIGSDHTSHLPISCDHTISTIRASKWSEPVGRRKNGQN